MPEDLSSIKNKLWNYNPWWYDNEWYKNLLDFYNSALKVEPRLYYSKNNSRLRDNIALFIIIVRDKFYLKMQK
ncbi:hypothetical protein YN1HA_26500 [Sulfurisphaera ohwakuensis]